VHRGVRRRRLVGNSNEDRAHGPSRFWPGRLKMIRIAAGCNTAPAEQSGMTDWPEAGGAAGSCAASLGGGQGLRPAGACSSRARVAIAGRRGGPSAGAASVPVTPSGRPTEWRTVTLVDVKVLIHAVAVDQSTCRKAAAAGCPN
jgi:hypothetical protein